MFELAKALERDCFVVTEFPLCLVLLMNDNQFPWLIMVPRVAEVKEVTELTSAQRLQLWHESDVLSRTLQSLYKPDKLNIAALGNMVPQLHVHHIARFTKDKAWPQPVWGRVPAQPYSEQEREQTITLLRQALDKGIEDADHNHT